jgi:hypothetical protein
MTDPSLIILIVLLAVGGVVIGIILHLIYATDPRDRPMAVPNSPPRRNPAPVDGQIALIPDDQVKKQIDHAVTRAVIIGAAFGYCLSLISVSPVVDTIEPSTHVAIARELFTAGQAICRDNGGLRNITVEQGNDLYTFNCANRMSLRDTIARIRPKHPLIAEAK